ncbi:hypothetical protein CSC94_17535 [Zhengella mangrovi]|uniref:CDP-alcohol phosphatidyltransferase n=1 Tax=Zhengella mangrovi TaxID=1982044 RepID=A0A2G1QJH7_9HYPH|nr:CDP-alcohol phosphatidyltransferase family protein [Zhengella mangrovi]PHP65652.1 hypothetical protein CSC94_17535 [Zhengella mangrovi]
MIIEALVSHVVRFGKWAFVQLCESGVSPNQITLIGLFLIIAHSTAYVITRDPYWLAVGLSLSFTTDALDGAVARYQGRSTRFGGYFDATIDRYQEAIVYFAVGIVTGYWTLLFVILFGSMMISYAKARVALERPTGNKDWPDYLQRPVRLWFLPVALFAESVLSLPAMLGGSPLYAGLVILAVLTNFTALQRILRAYFFLRPSSELTGGPTT